MLQKSENMVQVTFPYPEKCLIAYKPLGLYRNLSISPGYQIGFSHFFICCGCISGCDYYIHQAFSVGLRKGRNSVESS